ncbi:hypothetical protein ABIB49_001927 [Arthrobacter sp. UYCu512]
MSSGPAACPLSMSSGSTGLMWGGASAFALGFADDGFGRLDLEH